MYYLWIRIDAKQIFIKFKSRCWSVDFWILLTSIISLNTERNPIATADLDFSSNLLIIRKPHRIQVEFSETKFGNWKAAHWHNMQQRSIDFIDNIYLKKLPSLEANDATKYWLINVLLTLSYHLSDSQFNWHFKYKHLKILIVKKYCGILYHSKTSAMIFWHLYELGSGTIVQFYSEEFYWEDKIWTKSQVQVFSSALRLCP